MKNLQLMVVENGNVVCLGTDVTSVEVKDNNLVFVYDNDEREGVYALLDTTEQVIIQINR